MSKTKKKLTVVKVGNDVGGGRVSARKLAGEKVKVVRPGKKLPPCKMAAGMIGEPSETGQPVESWHPMHAAVLGSLKVWLNDLEPAARKKPIVATGGGKLLSPETLVQHVEAGTLVGRKYVESFSKLAVKNVIAKSLGKRNADQFSAI